MGETAMPPAIQAIVERGYATWASNAVSAEMRARFDSDRIPIAGVRQVRVWGVQVDDERELPGLERTRIPDEELWEVNLVATNGTRYAFDSSLLKPAPQ